MTRNILVLLICISLSGCWFFKQPKRIQVTRSSLEYIVELLPKQYYYLLPKNGDSMDDMERKLKAAIDQLLRSDAAIRETNKRVDEIADELEQFN